MSDINIENVRKAIGNVEGKKPDEIKTLLVTKGKVPFSKVGKVYKDLGFAAAKTGYAAEFYDLLRSKPMSDKEFDAWINAGSENVKRHKSHYNEIRLLANDIHKQ